MKAMIKELFYDKQMVDTIKKQTVNKEKLYNQLFSGQISLKEYLQLSK